MKIIHLNTVLRTITQNDIEQIRIWRNSIQVNRFLRHRSYIDEQGQLQWFNSINPKSSLYFVMEESSVSYGLIYAHDIDSKGRSFEGSIFIGDSLYMNTPFPVKCVMMMFIFFFEHLSFKYMHSTVHFENSAALELNSRFGFREIGRENDFVHSKCTKQDFENNAALFRKSLLRRSALEIITEAGDEKYPFLKNLIKIDA